MPAERLDPEMSTQQITRDRRKRVSATNSPGGIARHIRVQVKDGSQQWRLYASFANATQARLCAEQLDQRGIPTRMVESRCCPTAG